MARRDGHTIVLIDESGLSKRPRETKTWAPKGQSAVAQYRLNWKQLSVLAGIRFRNFHFRFDVGAIFGPQLTAAVPRHTKLPA